MVKVSGFDDPLKFNDRKNTIMKTLTYFNKGLFIKQIKELIKILCYLNI